MHLVRSLKRHFSLSTVPLTNISAFLNEKSSLPSSFLISELSESTQKECKEVAEALHKYGSLAIKDPRSNPSDNHKFLDLMETYFQTRSKEFYEHRSLEQLTDCFPELGFETGVTPEYVEKARDHSKLMGTLTEENQSQTPTPVPKDAKWRYMYFIGKDKLNGFDLAPDAHKPKDFEDFEKIFNKWGFTLLNATEIVAEMASLGLGFKSDFFTEKLAGGQHLLAPTGSDLKKHPKGTVFASFHYDFNFLTIHGRSRYPGLYVWLRDGTKIPVVMPEDYLLLQSGRQFEILTGGYVQCGFHEVIYSQATANRYAENISLKGEDQWRVSSTLFSHIRHDVMLEPKAHFQTKETIEKYVPLTSYDLLIEELTAINLLSKEHQ